MLNSVFFWLLYVAIFALIIYLSMTKNGVLESLDSKQRRQYNWVIAGASLVGIISLALFRSAIGAIISIAVLTGLISIYEDESTKAVNRNMLRVGYLFTNIASYVIINNTPELETYKMFLIVYFVAFLIVLLFFSGIGPSDARMFMLVSPVSVVLFQDNSLIFLLVTIMSCMTYQQYRQRLEIDSSVGVPMALPIYGTTFALIAYYAIDIILSPLFAV